MITNSIVMNEQHLSRASVNKIMEVLHNSVKSDLNLANDLLNFMKDRNINIPSISNEELDQLIPVSFKNKKSQQKIKKLKRAFENMDEAENLI